MQQYEELRNLIRHTRIKDKDYTLCIKLCMDYLKELNTLKDCFTLDDKRFIYYEMALDYKKLGNYQLSIKYNLIAINYIDHVEGKIDYRMINSKWLMAECYAVLENKKEALKLYDECSKMYKAIGEEKLRIVTSWNKAKLLKNSKAMLKLIKIYENKNLNCVVKTHGEMDSVYREMITDLFNLYIVKDKQKCFELYKMVNKELRRELALKLKVA